ncbi:MAG: protein TolQ [Magnetovibrionaceae bacterium]
MENGMMEAASAVAAHDFTLYALFLRADLVVKSVMIGLVLMSIICWAIIFEKLTGIRRLNKRADTFEQSFWSGGSLDDLYDHMGAQPTDPMSATFSAAMREWRRAAGSGGASSGASVGLSERIDRVMMITVAREMDRAERYMTFLASTGSTAPFIGLFGTVWGIMNAFQSIAMTQNTSLAVVAPGIAEALFATALGLFAAIPAVVAYNKLSRELDRFAGRLDSFAGEFQAILSRRMEDRS